MASRELATSSPIKYIDCGTSVPLSGLTQATLACWAFRPTSTSRLEVLWVNAAGTHYFAMGTYPPATTMVVGASTGTHAYRHVTAYVSYGSWEYWSVVFDGTLTGDDRLKFRVGQSTPYSYASGEGTLPASLAGSDAMNFQIGRSTLASSGCLAHVQLWNSALNIDQLGEAMWRPGSMSSNLIGWWPLFGVDSPEPDLSGLGNHGILVNAPANSSNGPPISMGQNPVVLRSRMPVFRPIWGSQATKIAGAWN